MSDNKNSENKKMFKEAQNLVLEIYNLSNKIERATEKCNELKSALHEYFDKLNISDIKVDESITGLQGLCLTAKTSQRVTALSYNLDVLKNNLDEQTFSEVVDKKYEITDINTLLSMVKQAGIKVSDFKKCLNIEKSVNKSRIQQLFSVGDITMEQMQGAYEATISKSIRITSSLDKEKSGDSD